MSIIPPPRAASASMRSTCDGGCTASIAPHATPPATAARPTPAIRARLSARSIATIRRADSGCAAGVVLQRRGMAQQDPPRHPGYRTGQRGRRTAAHHRRRGRREPAPPASTRRSPRRRRARRSRSSRRRRSRRPRATGRRAGSRPRSRRGLRPSSTSPTPRSPAATPCAAPPRGCSSTTRRRCVADLERLGVRFDADRHGNLALGLEGGHSLRRVVHAGGSATGRRIVRQLSALAVAAAADHRARGRARHERVAARTGAASGSCSRTAARSAPAPRSSRPAAPPRCGRARRTRRGRSASA